VHELARRELGGIDLLQGDEAGSDRIPERIPSPSARVTSVFGLSSKM
jgi:hypothetical protein